MVWNKKKSFNWKTELNWRDMLIDAPAGYSPQWLGAITDKNLRNHVQKLYLQLRRDADNGNGVSLMRDLVLRRIVWSNRILERVEQAIAHWDREVDAGQPGAEEMLLNYMRYHTHQTHELIIAIQTVLVEMPPMKTVDEIANARTPNKDRVVIKSESEE